MHKNIGGCVNEIGDSFWCQQKLQGQWTFWWRKLNFQGKFILGKSNGQENLPIFSKFSSVFTLCFMQRMKKSILGEIQQKGFFE